MELQADPVKEVLGELFTLLEAQEAQSTAVLQFLKAEGIATEEKLAPYLEQAGNGSNVKWRAARKRMEYLLTPVQKETDSTKESEKNKDTEGEQNKTKAVSPEPPAPKEADEHSDDQPQDDKHKGQDSEKHETEMAASAKAASGSGAPNPDTTASEKAPKPGKL